MIDSQESYNKELIKHLNKLLEVAKEKQPTELLAKIERYYKGDFDKTKDKVSNQRNVIKGIVETKTTLVIDSQIKTTVIPKTKNMADPSTLETVSDIATVFDDCVKDVFKNNNFDSWRQMCVRDLAKKMIVNETYWDAEDNEIKLRRIPFTRFFPDPSCVDIKDANYIFIEEVFSPITLKAKYPEYADKIASFSTKEGSKSKDSPSGKLSVSSGDETLQAFSYGDPSNLADNAKDIKVWKCYLKDDTTFTAEQTEKNANKEDIDIIKSKYPNGRMIMYIGASKDIVLDDKPIDYEFGCPIDVCYNIEGNSVWECQGDVEPLFENQNRINNAYVKAKEMVGKAGSWLLNDPKNGLKKSDFVNKTVLEVENKGTAGNSPEILTNNTIEKFNLMIDYMEMLKKDSLDIARLNEQMVSGNQEEQTTSGEQVKALNESPMTGIRALQRNYKEFLVNVTNKIISLVQQYYTNPRIIRISDTKFMYIPTRGQVDQTTGQPMAIQEYDKGSGGLSVTKEIKGNLDIGRYEVEVIAGSERPRSRSENANLMMRLYDIGLLGQGSETTAELLEELDVPNRKQIVERLKKQEESMPQPTIFDSTELAKNFSDIMGKIEGFTAAKRLILKNNGLPDKPDSLVDAPVQEVTKESDLEGVAEIAPVLVSNDPVEQAKAQAIINENQAMDKQHEIFMQSNKNVGSNKK